MTPLTQLDVQEQVTVPMNVQRFFSAFQQRNRWGSTATDGAVEDKGDATTITWTLLTGTPVPTLDGVCRSPKHLYEASRGCEIHFNRYLDTGSQ